ncbi:MAG: 23S rRNA (uridine(2552)-2'-O)-methyltransferase [Gammaproteobacteria bacterium]|nr:23S rRNA (uridine(2552)-2'-O)-methyltransferase [Gammaproteobacteria bacterium]
MSKPRRSSGSWRERQERDPFVVRARSEGWRSRAVYKLEQIDKKEKLLRPGMLVVDLGAAPGSWSQYVTEKLEGRVRIIALDILEMDALPSVEFIQGDFREDEVLKALEAALGDERADLVISDMAPNISGSRSVDQPRSMYLAELALELCDNALKKGGDFVCKLFQGEGTDAFIASARQRFGRVRVMKPEASRLGSREVYLVARNYRL